MQATAPDLWTQGARARDEHADVVGSRCAGHEQAIRGVWKTEHLARPAENLALHLDSHVVAATGVDVEAGRQHLRQHADRRAAALNPSHEAWMGIAARIGQHVPQEAGVYLRQVGRLARQARCAQPPVRRRTPERSIPQALQVIEYVVEHPMALKPQRVPVLRVQAGIGDVGGRRGHDSRTSIFNTEWTV